MSTAKPSSIEAPRATVLNEAEPLTMTEQASTEANLTGPGLVRRLSAEERQRRLAEELAEWSQDQYKGDTAKRRDGHRSRWAAFFSTLGMDPASLPLPQSGTGKACVVGCNLGGFEWDVLESYPQLQVDACDLINPETEPPLWQQTREKFGDRVHYYPSTDVQVSLPGGPYDLIVIMAVLHHCPEPEAAAQVLHDALAPGGLLLVSEYVGAPGISCSDQRYRVADQLWQALPEAYKRREDGSLQEHPYRPIAENATGFESIASDQILPAIRPLFEVIKERFLRPLLGYRMIIWEEGSLRRINNDIERLLGAFEEVLMAEDWLSGEDWYALLRKRE